MCLMVGLHRCLCQIFAGLWIVSVLGSTSLAQSAPIRSFASGTLPSIEELPSGRLRFQLERLSKNARLRALASLRDFQFPPADLESLRADTEGGIYYVDHFKLEPAPLEELPRTPQPFIAAASLPVSPFPTNLIFHSRPGSANVLYLNFTGETVTNTAWNTALKRASIPAVGFSLDSDFSSFTDTEQLAIQRIWQRVSEDYAPFEIDVTTERPAVFGRRTAHALITRNADAHGEPNSESAAGGIAYVNMFGTANYATYRPAWIYYNNLASKESYIAEAVSHEIGHNLGLSHDGQTNGVEYYKGHGSGNTSWGPIMGASWGRQVSQWSKGEYYGANNTQDDLAIIAAKLSRRGDDHTNTFASATALLVTEGTNILATMPHEDPANRHPVNKGILETTSDEDMFSFVTGSGEIYLTVNPLIIPSGLTPGGNLDLVAELYSQAGQLLLIADSEAFTSAHLQTNLSEGLYFIRIRSTGAGDPANSNSSGYTAYGSIGQYFIMGAVVNTGYVSPPQGVAQAADVVLPGSGANQFTVTYTDNVGIDKADIDSQDIRVTGPNGYDLKARLISVSPATNGTLLVAVYAADPPDGDGWLEANNGIYSIWMQSGQVHDLEGALVPEGLLGQFHVKLLRPIYAASLETDPGWALEPLWQYGQPSYRNGGPAAGFSGSNIVAYNLSGNYQNQLDPKYATMPPIDCSGASALTLRFRRWLQLRSGDTAMIQISTNGATWTDLWSTTQTVSDTAWQEMIYSLPVWTDQSPSLQLRWGIWSGVTLNAMGWNIDDIEILGRNIENTVTQAVSLFLTANNPNWGSVNGSNDPQPIGSSVELTAIPAPHFRFVEWMGGISGTSNPVSLVLRANLEVQAVFAEILTTNHSTPCWWLAEHGFTNDWEAAVDNIGANGLPLWQSYIAGLNPDDPASQLRLMVARDAVSHLSVLNWNTVTGRVYSLIWSTNLVNGFASLPNASNLPSNIQSYTNSTPHPNALYRLEVMKP